jgi:hypothetical protein
MSKRTARCPRCRLAYTWGATVCPACHVALDLFSDPAPGAPAVAVFETGDHASADIVAGLLGAHGLACAIRGTDDAVHVGRWWAGYWHILVRSADAAQAQAILDAEIGREAND